MTTHKPSRSRALFETALEQDPEVWESFVIQNSGGDHALARAVLELLSAHRAVSDEFLENPLLRARAPSPVQNGAQIGPHRVVGELGRGGMGTVYSVERSDGVFERRAALKVIQPEQNRADIRERFHNERRVLAKLDHPNIVRIIDGGDTEDGFPYYVMDYVDGEPIDRYCAHKQLSVAQRLVLFEQVCLAVEYLHQQHIVHGDIKPSNILVDGEGMVKLLDFGISQFTHDSAESASQTEGRHMLTVAYASPEQIRGEPVSGPSDVYSLGVVLYQLLTGRRPFESPPDEPLDTFTSAILTRKPALPSTSARAGLAEGIPNTPGQLSRIIRGDLDSILLTALSHEPESRYYSPARMEQDIDRYLTHHPVVARSGGFLYRGAKFAGRNRNLVTAAVIVLLIGAFSLKLALENQRLINLHEELRQMPARLAASLGLETGTAESLSRLTVEQLQTVSDFATQFRDNFVEALRISPGLTQEREEILHSAIHLIDEGRQIAGTDPDKQYWVAYAYYAIANLQGYPHETNLGDFPGALNSYEESRSLVNQILSVQPGDARAKELLTKIDARVFVVQQTGQ